MAAHPKMHGMRPNLIVFSRPMDSMRNPARIQPMGTDMTITEAIHEDSEMLAWMSVSSLSSTGIIMAEKASATPMTM